MKKDDFRPRQCDSHIPFQRLMSQELTRVTTKYGNLVMCYVDDVVIATPSLEDHRTLGRSVCIYEKGQD